MHLKLVQSKQNPIHKHQLERQRKNPEARCPEARTTRAVAASRNGSFSPSRSRAPKSHGLHGGGAGGASDERRRHRRAGAPIPRRAARRLAAIPRPRLCARHVSLSDPC
jgi:hypothetical protein